MRIAYLLYCHLDARHVARLAHKLTADDPDCGVFIHVDAKSDILPDLVSFAGGHARIRFTERRIDVYWGAYSQVEAIYELIRLSLRYGDFDRFMILQGADYPIKSAAEIHDTLERNPATEYVRACDASIATTPYLYAKARYRMFYDRPTILKKISNKATRILRLKSRSGFIPVAGRDWHVFWGSAQIGFTRALAEVFLSYEDHPALKRFFKQTFPAVECYFQTIAFNSGLRPNMVDGGPVPEREGLRLADTRSICYFEYPKHITIFREEDFERLRQVPHFFIRKTRTEISDGLLDRIDAMHSEETSSRVRHVGRFQSGLFPARAPL